MVEHQEDGSLKLRTDGTLGGFVQTSGAQTIAGVKTFSSSPVIPVPINDTDAATKAYVDGVASSGAPDATASVKGVVQLTGDLGGTAASPTVPSLAGKQDANAALTAIASLSPVNDDVLQHKAGSWTNRTPTQFKTDLALTKSDVGLSNVDDTSDLSKPISTLTQTALNGKANTTTTISAGTGLTGGGDLSANRTLAVVYGATADTAAQGNDSRLSDARTPLTHAASHASGGTDAVTPTAIGAVPTTQTLGATLPDPVWSVVRSYSTAQVADANTYEMWLGGTLVSWMNEWGGLRFRIPNTSQWDAAIRIIAASNQNGHMLEIQNAARTENWIYVDFDGSLHAAEGFVANAAEIVGNLDVGGNLVVDGNLSVTGTYPGNVVVSATAPPSPTTGMVWIDTSP